MSVPQISRITVAQWADTEAIKQWRDKARVQAISAMALVRNVDYSVIGARNSRGTLLGLIAFRENPEDVLIVHLARRDKGYEIGAMLIIEVCIIANKRRVHVIPEKDAESLYSRLGWRHIGKEYWSK